MEQVNKRITYKDITIGTRKFRLNKFDALTGSFMLFKLVGILAPIFKNIDIKKAKDTLKSANQSESKDTKEEDISGSDIAAILTEITKLPKEDFDYIQKNCLMVANEIYPDNPQPSPPVLNEFGTFGILDYDMPLILHLTIRSLIFNVSDFFGGDLLNLNLEGLTTSLRNSLT